MTLPPRWKIKREVYRIRDKLERRVTSALIDPPRQFLYDRRVDSLLEITEGEHALTPRVAVFVLFQPKGLAASTLFTLDHLIANDWSPVVISNAPLSERDKAEVARRAAKVIERPNVGYDFGAYREGIRFLDRIGHKADRLILMNDSTWFPLREGDDTLARMEATGADMVGHVLKNEILRGVPSQHVESHLLMFNKAVLESESFQRFWREYRMSNTREVTIERGERDISRSIMRGELSIAGIHSPKTMKKTIADLDERALLETLLKTKRNLLGEENLLLSIVQDARDGRDYRNSFILWVDDVLMTGLEVIPVTFSYTGYVHGGLSYLKKSNEPWFHSIRRQVLALDQDGLVEPLHVAVRKEIVNAVEAWTPKNVWRLRPENLARYLEE